MMRVLVTNDDGVDSPGIRALARACEVAGLEVTVAAPAWDSSGASASLTGVQQDGRLLLHRRGGWGAAQVFGVEAAPAFIVPAGVHGAFGEPPDIVVSGINIGANTGHAVLHSGTVGAALTAWTFGRHRSVLDRGRRVAALGNGGGGRTHRSPMVDRERSLDRAQRQRSRRRARGPSGSHPRPSGPVRCGADEPHRSRRGVRQVRVRWPRRRPRARHRTRPRSRMATRRSLRSRPCASSRRRTRRASARRFD